MISTSPSTAYKACKAANIQKLLAAVANGASDGSESLKFELDEKYIEMLTPEFLSERANEVETNGYTIINGVLDDEQVNNLKQEMANIVEAQAKNDEQHKHIFGSNAKGGGHMGDSTNYFLDSGSKISLFYENDAFDENGELKLPLMQSMNKVGHALHDLNDAFSGVCYSNAFKTLAYYIHDLQDPMVVQSMYMFKNKKIGRQVTPHQDSSYVTADPLSCKAIWVALDDAHQENGCMWCVPGSHKTEPVEYWMQAERSVKYDEETGEKIVESKIEHVPGPKPDYDIENSVPLEVKKGGVIMFDGSLIHYSYPNTSEKQRNAFTMHMVETVDTTYSPKAWLQRDESLPFKKMYEQNVQ